MPVPGSQPVAQDERAHAHRVEQGGDLPPLVIHRQRPVAAARGDDHCRAGRTACGAVVGQHRLIGIRIPEGSRRSPLPQQHILGNHGHAAASGRGVSAAGWPL